MIKEINVLIVDDHPFIIEAYQTAFNELESLDRFTKYTIVTATNADEALTTINEANGSDNFDLIVLDMCLPKVKNRLIFSGEDIGRIFKYKYPNGKMIVITALKDNFRLNSILDMLDPDGLLIKSDINMKQLKDSFKTVLNDPPCYSKTVLRLIRKTIDNDFVIDGIDKQLLYLLSIGVKMKDISSTMHLSISGLERRKRQLKETFKGDVNDNRTLIELAREKGFI